ncbi:LysR family transcriptional regulator [Mycolicibacterium frederiksbergense]|uniref:Probable hydrogen peroxide-inducible genes activator n=1 Tax=Mycolicibacterium frederiksbergense TaxID=117567 RepID=A0A6H0RYH3_9MYCO|nr:LysR family transcriptional regulator [Mycolicibacterium frederiksbergense]QIV79966.1 LysR family transcriptional regulator [Mycolicibacterium frederiksbergense]
MELRQLRYFAEVVETGSFLGASNRLDTAQPSLWRQVKSLEKELGVPLFERSGRRVKVSSAGLLLLPLTEQVLAGADKIKSLASEITRGRAGTVTIACAYPHLLRFLAPLIGGFHMERPDVHVAIQGLPGLPPIDRVLSGEADFVTSIPVADRRLQGHLLGQARIAVVTPDDHPWRNRSEVKVAELAGVSVLVGPDHSLTRRLLEPALRTEGVILDIMYESHDMASLVALARAGLGVAVVADDHLPGEPADHDWPVLCDDDHEMATPVWIYWAANRALSPPVQEFVRHVRNSV